MIKRIVGILGIILGVAGIILAVVLLIGIWVINPTITNRLQGAVRRVNQGLTTTSQVLTTADTRASELRAAIQTRSENLQPVLDRFSGSVGQMRAAVDTTRSAIDVAQEVMGVANSVPLLARSLSELPQGGTLEEAARILDKLSETLTNLEQEAPNLSEAGQEVRDRISTRIGEIEGDVSRLIATVEQARSDLERTEARIPSLINRVSIVVSLIAIWFGLAQYCLLLVSRRWLVESKDGPDDGVDQPINNRDDD